MYLARVASDTADVGGLVKYIRTLPSISVHISEKAAYLKCPELSQLIEVCLGLLSTESCLKVVIVETPEGMTAKSKTLAKTSSKFLEMGFCWIHLIDDLEFSRWSPNHSLRRIRGRFQLAQSGMITVGIGETSQAHQLDRAVMRLSGCDLLLPANTFFARTDEISAVFNHFQTGKFVTLTGCGGIGKTRISQQITILALGQFASEVHYIRLADTSNSSDVISRIRAKLANISHAPEVTHLLVLDNCEHVIESVRQVLLGYDLDTLNVRVLATSREPLGVAHEYVIRLQGLEFPDPNEEIDYVRCCERFGALQLLSDRVNMLRGRGLQAEELEAAVRMVQLVEGIPLALEQIAVNIQVQGIEKCLEQVENRLGKLSFLGIPQECDPRHETMQAMLMWSYDLLAPDQRRAFDAASAFAATFSADHLNELGQGSFNKADIHALWKKSLIERLDHLDPTSHLRLLECVREFGRENYLEVNYLSRLDNLCFEVINDYINTLEGEKAKYGLHDFQVLNLTVVESLERQLAVDFERTVETLTASMNLFVTSGVTPRLRDLFNLALNLLNEKHPKELVLRNCIGVLNWYLGDHEQAKEAFSALEEIAEKRGMEVERALALANIASLELNFGEPKRAESPLVTASQIFEKNREWTRFYTVQLNLLHLYIQLENTANGLALADLLRTKYWPEIPDHVKPSILLNSVDIRGLTKNSVQQIDELIILLDLMTDDGRNVTMAPALLRAIPIIALVNKSDAAFAWGIASEALEFDRDTVSRQKFIKQHTELFEELQKNYSSDAIAGRMVEVVMRGIETKLRIRPSLLLARDYCLSEDNPLISVTKGDYKKNAW